MERKNIIVLAAETNFGYHGRTITLEKFIEDTRQAVPEEYRDSISLTFVTSKDPYNTVRYEDDEVIVRIIYQRPETDEEMSSRIKRKLTRK